tara:strand:+ start:374 stop:934 length:561 start_codon:yes stop_codon:yes gene_type:complete
MQILIALLLTMANVYAEDCSFTTDSSKFDVSWEAYKTPAKIGVGGNFKSLGIQKAKTSSSNLQDLFEGVEFGIETSSVNTNNAPRDKKIHKFFFQNVEKLEGKVLEADDSSMLISLKMNGVQKEIPLTGGIDQNGTYSMSGTIDVFDFNMMTHLKGITEACKALHAGKTWNDVNIKFTVPVTKTCK